MIAFRVSGRVQGVGFRSSTARLATVLGLSGWVRNVGDGTVQGRVGGAPADLERFFARLPGASARGRVDGIERRELPAAASLDEGPGFEVLGSVPAPTPDWPEPVPPPPPGR